MVYLYRIKLINCQSWDDNEIILSNGLNVIKATNSTGKSVIAKILKTLVVPNYYNRKEREQLIRYDCECAEAMFELSDKSVVYMRIYPERIIYYYTPDYTTTPYESYEGSPPDIILEKLSMLVDRDTGFIVNILDREQDLLLVDTNSNTNQNLINVLVENENLDNLIHLFKSKYDEYTLLNNQLTDMESHLIRKMAEAKYIDTTELVYNIEHLDIYIDILDLLESADNSIDDLKDDIDNNLVDFSKGLFYIDSLDMLYSLKEVNELNEDIEEIDVDIANTKLLEIDILEELYKINLEDLDYEESDNNRLSIYNKLLDVYEEIKEIEDFDDTDIESLHNVKCEVDTYNLLIQNRYHIKSFLEYDFELRKTKVELDRLKVELENADDEIECPFCGTIKYEKGYWIKQTEEGEEKVKYHG